MTVRADHATAVRADRAPAGSYRLAAPRRLDSGAWEFESVVSTPGVNRYPDLGTVEYVSPDAIRADEYLTALRGLPLIDDPALHWPGVTVEQIETARVGTVLDARWDDEQQATIARIVVDTPRGIDAISSGRATGVSLHYTPVTVPADLAPDGSPVTHVQTARHKLNHLLLTPTPNDAAARIRADEASMDPEQMKALIHEIVGEMITERLSEMGARIDACTTRMDAIAPAKTPEGEEVKPEPEVRADTAADWRRVIDVAARHDIKIPDGSTLVEAQRAVVAARLPARADSQDPAVLAALLDALSVAPAQDVWTRAAVGGSVRAGAADPIARLVTVGA